MHRHPELMLKIPWQSVLLLIHIKLDDRMYYKNCETKEIKWLGFETEMLVLLTDRIFQ